MKLPRFRNDGSPPEIKMSWLAWLGVIAIAIVATSSMRSPQFDDSESPSVMALTCDTQPLPLFDFWEQDKYGVVTFCRSHDSSGGVMLLVRSTNEGALVRTVLHPGSTADLAEIKLWLIRIQSLHKIAETELEKLGAKSRQ